MYFESTCGTFDIIDVSYYCLIFKAIISASAQLLITNY